MPEHPLLQDLGVILVAATAVSLLARRLRVPSIVAYIVAGLLIGPGLGLVGITYTMELVAEVGIILLLFLVGLELSLDKIREVGTVAVVAGLVQMAVTGGAVAGIAWGFGLSGGDVVFLGVALTFSSTVVVVKLLDQLRALDARHGRISVGILLVQDLVVVIVLTFVAGLGGAGDIETQEVVVDLATAFAGMILLLAGAGFLAWKVLPGLFGMIAHSQAALLTWSLSWCFVLVLGSEMMELSLELGAFIAGVALAQLPYNHDLRRRVHPLMNFFVAVFFVTLGIQMELGAAIGAWPIVLALVMFTLLVKPPLIAWLVGRMGEPSPTAMRSGLNLGQTSEFSFILAALALANGLIDDTMLSIVGAVGLITMGASSFSMTNGGELVSWFERRGLLPLLAGAPRDPDDRVPVPAEAPVMRDHIIVVGMNSLGRRIVVELHERGQEVLAVDTDPSKLRGLPCHNLLGNVEYMAVLEEAGLGRARLLVSALHIEEVNRLLAYRAARADVPSAINSFDAYTTEELLALGVTHLIDSQRLGVERIAAMLRQQGLFG